MPHFSLVVIGSGSGNIVASEHPAGGSAALIESGAFGGTCINRGCIPSKILIHTADLAAQIRRSTEFGINAGLTGGTVDPVPPRLNHHLSMHPYAVFMLGDVHDGSGQPGHHSH